jgi:ABC-type multidrug transport system fused ATPase/permease subunit
MLDLVPSSTSADGSSLGQTENGVALEGETGGFLAPKRKLGSTIRFHRVSLDSPDGSPLVSVDCGQKCGASHTFCFHPPCRDFLPSCFIFPCQVRDLSFEVVPGQSVMLMGQNGTGKSSLFRVMAGLWPLQVRKGCLDKKSTRHKEEREEGVYPLILLSSYPLILLS